MLDVEKQFELTEPSYVYHGRVPLILSVPSMFAVTWCKHSIILKHVYFQELARN